jgi:flagellar basal-body rod modification protein FlgD
LSGNFDTFLKLLTTQLQNQDPTQPMDSSQFTQELVQFSQVEQQIDTNSNLESLISLTKSNSGTSAISYLGKTVTLDNGNASLSNGQAQWDYNVSSTAQSTSLVVTNDSGKVVYSGDGETSSGTHTFTWDGKDNNGDAVSDGTYTLSVSSTTSDGTKIDTSVASYGKVTGVDLSGDEPKLEIGSMSISLSDAKQVSSS